MAQIDEPSRLQAFINNRPAYSEDFKGLSLRLIEQGQSVEQVAALTGVSQPTLYEWLAKWTGSPVRQKKESGLTNAQGQGGGAACRLNAQQQQQLRRLLTEQDFWTLPQIATLIVQHFNRSYSPIGLRRLLKRMKLYHYKPQPRDYRQSPTAEKQLSGALQATVDALTLRGESLSEFAIGFADEFAPQLHHNRARLWSVSTGKIRPLNTTRVSQPTFGFYALQGHSVVEFMANGKAPTIQAMLRSVRQANPTARRIVLIWDNARSHLDRSVQALAWRLGIYLVALPTYSPNLNPIERIWKTVRRQLSEIGLIDSVDTLRHHIRALFEKYSQSRSFAKSWIDRLLKPIYQQAHTWINPMAI